MSKANKLKIKTKHLRLRSVWKRVKKVWRKDIDDSVQPAVIVEPGFSLATIIRSYLSKFGDWVAEATSNVVGRAFQMVVPSYFWYVLLGLIATGMVVGIVLIIVL